MNEILAVIYFVFWEHRHRGIIALDKLESDVFFCFSNLMAEIRNQFMRELDKEEGGIDDKCKHMNEIIKVVDPDVVKKLDAEGVTPQFYAIRWIMLMFCQEFDIYNSSVIWDSLFSDENRF